MNKQRPTLSRARVAAGRIAALTLLISLGAAALISVHDDRQIRLHVSGTFEFLTADSISERVTPLMEVGFFRMNVEAVRLEVESLGWVHHARIRRTWPYGLRIRIWEQQPVARWNDVAWLNPDGEIFEADADLPRLSRLPALFGPVDSEKAVLEAWQATSEQLKIAGHVADRLRLDERGAWDVTLGNGVELRLGRDEVDVGVTRFVRSVVAALGERFGEIEYVDLRHTNGFAVGWRPAVAMAAPDGRGS